MAGAALRCRHFYSAHDALVLRPAAFLDDAYYHQLASLVASGNLRAGPEIFFLPPFYIYFLGLIYFLFSAGLTPAFLVQVGLGALTVWLGYGIGVMIKGERAGLFAALLLALDGLAAMYECTLLPAALDPLLIALLLWLTLRAMATGHRFTWALAGAAAGSFALNRPNALALLPLLPLFALWSPEKAKARAALLALAAAAVVIFPVSLRNYLVGGDPVLVSSHGGLNFYIGNRQGATGFYESPPWLEPDVRGQAQGAPKYLSGRLGRAVGPAEVSGILYRLAWEEIRDDPGAFLKLAGKKTLSLVNAREAGLNLSFDYMREALSPALWLMPVGMWLLVPLGAMGIFAGRRERMTLAVAALGLVYGATVIMFFISDRYRLPLHVPLAALSGVGLQGLIEAAKARRKSEVIKLAAVFVAALLISSLNLGVPSGRGQMRLMHALRLIEEGRIEEAKTVAAGMPKGEMNPFFWREKLARAFLAGHAPEAAIAEIKILIELAPQEGSLHCELGQLYLASHQPSLALPELQTGLHLDPSNDQCRQALAEAAR